ncbi:hypothetical protein CHS0354_042642 [Potamilus streckersoni]|uniref:Uncharacterized protein n=1 Tax=Potamilus streckersoni TaxID=2493646 RepID=A0AAE0WCU1_9BIVA|nr:hypothetical protein CHS0354_042642 [Potamilus streckersoni]
MYQLALLTPPTPKSQYVGEELGFKINIEMLTSRQAHEVHQGFDKSIKDEDGLSSCKHETGHIFQQLVRVINQISARLENVPITENLVPSSNIHGTTVHQTFAYEDLSRVNWMREQAAILSK